MKGDLGKLVEGLKKANQLNLGAAARTNTLADIEAKIVTLEKDRNTAEDQRKIKAIRLLLEVLKAKGNVLKAEDLATLKEQGELYKSQMDYYKSLLKRSITNEALLNTAENPAPSTVRQAKLAINESLNSLRGIIERKYRNSPTKKAKNAADKKEQNQRIQQEVAGIIAGAIRQEMKAMPAPPGYERDELGPLRARLAAATAKPVDVANLRRRLDEVTGKRSAPSANKELNELEEELKSMGAFNPGEKKGGKRKTRKHRKHRKHHTRKH